MNERTMERTFQCVFASPFVADQITILWHAGEPLVPGVDYYRRAFALLEQCRPSHVTVRHNFQTNATLIDDRWIDFFRTQANVSVGVSIDGPARLHNQHRKTRGGRGSFAQVMRGVRRLQDAGLPFHVITVLTRDSLREARALFEFYVEHGITQVAFNIEEIEGNHVSSSLTLDGIDEAMRAFLREFVDLTHAHAAKLEVRELLGAFAGIANPDSGLYGNPMAQPMRVVSVGVDGEISTFSPELLGYSDERHGAFVFGNVHDNELADILDGPRFRAVEAEINCGLERCRNTCDYFEVCRGGSPVNKLFENGSFDSTETLFCRLSKKAVIDVVLERVEWEFELASRHYCQISS